MACAAGHFSFWGSVLQMRFRARMYSSVSEEGWIREGRMYPIFM